MTCGLDDGVELHFLSSGIKIRVFEVDFRSQREHFGSGQFTVSREAGELVHGSHDEYEPVELIFDGVTAYRLMIGNNAVTFKENMDKHDRAIIDLEDGLQVLKHGEVSFTTDSIRISDAIDKVLTEAQDEHGVITGVEYTDREVTLRDMAGEITIVEGEIMRRQVGNDALQSQNQMLARDDQKRGQILEEDVPAVDTVEKVLDAWADQLTNSAVKPNNTFGGFDFDGVSPLQAIQDILEEWEYNFWLNLEGTLVIGRRASASNTLFSSPDNKNVRLSDYSVTGAAERTSSVFVRGPYIAASDQPVGDDEIIAFKRGLEIWARAEFEGLSGEAEYFVGKKSLRSMQSTEDAAGQILITNLMEQVHGSAEINGLASTDNEAVAKVAPGDTLVVDPKYKENCADGLTTGPYLIEHVKHSASTSKGWRIDLDLSRIPGPGLDFETSSTLYDPVSGKQFEDFEAFKKSVVDD